MFIAILTYRKPLSEVDKVLASHRDYLAEHYAAGDFITSGLAPLVQLITAILFQLTKTSAELALSRNNAQA